MSARRASGTVRPVIKEIKPDNASSIAPSSPPTSPKVRFASTDDTSRPLTSVEAWSLYHFETHARTCDSCYDLLDKSSSRRSSGSSRRLCLDGHALAQDAALHVQYRDGEYFEKPSASSKPSSRSSVRVEVPHGYTMLKSLLKAIAHSARTSRPIVTYSRPTERRTSIYDSDSDAPRTTTIVEPTRSSTYRSKKPRPTHFSPDAEETYEVRPPAPPRRGTQYEKDMQRQKVNYLVEIREPSSGSYASSSRRERPRTMFWS